MRKIDIHCHTTNRQLDSTVYARADVEAIQRHMPNNEIEHTVLLPTYFPHKGTGISNYRMKAWIGSATHFSMFGSLDFEHYFLQGYNEVEELAHNKKIRGIKVYTCYQEIDLKGEKLRKVAGLAAVHHLPLMFHTGYAHGHKKGSIGITDSVKPSDLEWILETHPQLPVIFSHLANPFIDDLIKVVKKHPKAYSDMSGLIHSLHDREDIPKCVDMIRKYLEACGPEKLFFGSDFPVQTYEDSIHFIEEAMCQFSNRDKEDVYYTNAAELILHHPPRRRR